MGWGCQHVSALDQGIRKRCSKGGWSRVARISESWSHWSLMDFRWFPMISVGFPWVSWYNVSNYHFPFRMGTFMAFHGNQQRPMQPCRRLLPGGPPSALPPVWLQCDFQLLDARPGFGKNLALACPGISWHTQNSLWILMNSYEFLWILPAFGSPLPILEESVEDGCLRGGIDWHRFRHRIGLVRPSSQDAFPFHKRNPLSKDLVFCVVLSDFVFFLKCNAATDSSLTVVCHRSSRRESACSFCCCCCRRACFQILVHDFRNRN